MTDELREAFEAAFEEHEEEAPEEAQGSDPSPEVEQPSTEQISDDPAPNNAVEKSEPDAPESGAEPTPEKSAVGETPASSAVDRQPKIEGSVKAPASWSATARETWKDLPDSAQQEVMKREREITMTLQQTAGARNVAKQLNDTLAPYKEAMIAQGVNNPLEAVGTLLATESRLRGGSPQEKALTVANLIKNYGVDISALDSMLVSGGHSAGQAPAAAPDHIQQMLDERLAPVNQFLQQQQQAAQYAEQQQVAQAQNTVSQFSQNAEFINDVRMEMADLMDMAAKRGMQMTIEQAYDRACAFHPEVSKIIEGRKQQQSLMGSQQQVQKKRAAASSITGTRGGSGVSQSSGNLRDSIAEAWDDMSQY